MPISEIVQLSAQIEKLGIVGVLAVLCGLLGYATWYFRRALTRAMEQLTKAKIVLALYKQAADAANLKVDLSGIAGIEALIGKDE